jgi:hypothetical protein
MKQFKAIVVTALLMSSLVSFAQSIKSNQCDGVPVVLRISDIVNGGSVEGVKKAAQMHEAWYRNNGVMKNRQVIGEVYTTDGRNITADNSKVVSLHINRPSPDEGTATRNWGDAGFKEFVAQYNKNNKVTNEINVCFPKGVFTGY